jgi:hypothetical protein
MADTKIKYEYVRCSYVLGEERESSQVRREEHGDKE